MRDQQVRATVHWFLATGRENPVYAITFDSSAAGPNGVSVSIDSRAPYGDIAWDGDGTQAEVDGVKWGDKYRFFSRDEPLTARSRWDYSQPNVVPYAMAYSRRADAAMGLVQSYSVFMVMGQQSTEAVMAQVARTLGAELRVNRGQAVQEGPGGVGRTDTVSYPVPGYNATYGVYELEADALRAPSALAGVRMRPLLPEGASRFP